MPTYKQIWFPAGEAAGGDAKEGRGAFTRRYLHIDYVPLGDSEDPALTISHRPLDDTGLEVPALKIEAGINSQGDALLIEKFSQTGAFLTGEFQGNDIFSIEGDGDIWNLGTMYAHKANVGGIAAATDGTVALDMTLGNVFTCTTSQNTSWSTVAPTNGIGGELASFVVDNAGGHTVAWAAGFTDVDAIGAGDTGISTRLLQFDGTTWHQIASTLDGEAENVTGGAGVFREIATGNIFGPNGAGRDALTGDYNFATISGAGDALTTGWYNILAGRDAGTELTVAIGNIALGRSAFRTAINPDYTVAIGFLAAEDVAYADYVTIVGAYAAYEGIDIGNGSILIGAYCGSGIVEIGEINIGIGPNVYGAADGDSTHNIGIGDSVFLGLTIGSLNIGMGKDSLQHLTEGDNNVGYGNNSLLAITTGSNNVAIGSFAGIKASIGSSDNIFLGFDAGPTAVAAISDRLYIHNAQSDTPLIHGEFDNTRITIYGYLQLGEQAADAPTVVVDGAQLWVSDGTGTGDEGDGYVTVHTAGNPGTNATFKLWDAVTGGAASTSIFREIATGNIFGPSTAGRDATTGDHNFAAVQGAGDALTSGDDNVLIGENAGGALTEGLRNIFLGFSAGASETTGDDNFAAGDNALGVIVTGNDNFAAGPNAMGGYVDGNNNIAIGPSALFGDSSTSNGSNNTAFGANALFDVTSGAWNIGMSQHACGNVTTGEYNVGIGTSTLWGITTGDDNIAIGESSGYLLQTTSYNNVCIGNSAGPASGAVYSGLMWIDEHATDTPTIAADFTNNRVGILVDPSALANILEIQATSATDPIADNWTTYPSDRNHKDIISESEGLLESFQKIKTYKYKRKPLVSDLEVKHEAQKRIKTIIKGNGQRGLVDMTKTEDFLDENDLYEELKEAKSELPKFTAERVGVSIDDPDMPDEILVKDKEGNIAGIDLLGYVGYLHAVLKELAEKVAA